MLTQKHIDTLSDMWRYRRALAEDGTANKFHKEERDALIAALIYIDKSREEGCGHDEYLSRQTDEAGEPHHGRDD